MAAARSFVDPALALADADFSFGSWCPPGARCAAMTSPNVGIVVFHANGLGPDIAVSVQADAAGTVTATAQRPIPSPAAPSLAYALTCGQVERDACETLAERIVADQERLHPGKKVVSITVSSAKGDFTLTYDDGTGTIGIID